LLSKINGDSESRDRLFLECHFELASCQYHLPESPDNAKSLHVALDFLKAKNCELDSKTKSKFEIRFRYLHARLLVLQRKHVEAIEYSKEALKLFEELSEASSLKAYRGRLHLIAGTAGRVLRRYRPRDFHLQRAMTIFNEIHDESPEDHSIWDDLADCHSEFGLKFRMLKKYAQAIEHFNHSLQFSRMVQKSFPNRKSHTARVNRALLERAECDLKTGETERAIDSFWQVSQRYQDLSVERRTDLTAFHLGKLGVQIWKSLRNDDTSEGKKILDCSQSLVEPIALKNTHPSYNELYASILFQLAEYFEREGEAATSTDLADQAIDVIVQSKRLFNKSESKNYRMFFRNWVKFAARAGRKEEIFAKVNLFINTSEPSANTHIFAAGILSTAAYWFERPIKDRVPISPEIQKTYPKDLVSEAIFQMKTAVEVDPKMDYRMFLILNSLYPLRGHKEFEAIIADLKKQEKK